MLFSPFFRISRSWSLFFDRYVSTLINELKQVYDINISHSDASVAGWHADFVLVPGAVNVNETVARVGVVFIQAIKPQDAGHHEVCSRRKRIFGFQRDATLKHSITRQAAADLLCNLETAGWCFHAAFFRPDSKSRRGHRVTANWRLAFHHSEALIANRDVNIFHPLAKYPCRIENQGLCGRAAVEKYPPA